MFIVGGLDEGSVVNVIFFAFLAKPTHKALLFDAMSGEERDISPKFLTFVPWK